MAGTELAKAYVQVVPSAKGIKGSIKKILGGEAEEAGNSSGESFAKRLIGTAKKAIAAAGIGKAIAATINEGAALQQSIGGIETLFKDSADTMKQYAAVAYRTAGMSANEYMETVTGFSASLLQGLGGDTAKAAKIADMAMIDMSDNANKMGTDMGSIQNAYQGFAKQNYTMLDNLKLGYGGTKNEMQRLLKDAQKFSGIKYDINNLSDVYEAIHVVQGELEISGRTAEEAADIIERTGRSSKEVYEQLGTTAKEATTTFSGSMAAMKAAAKNMLGTLAIGGNIDHSLYELRNSVFTFLTGNLIPMVGKIFDSLPNLLSGISTTAIGLMNIASHHASEIVNNGIKIVGRLAVSLLSEIPYFVESGIKLVTALGKALLSADWKGIANNLIADLKENMDQAAGEILGTDGNLIDSVCSSITANLPSVLQKGIEVISSVSSGMLQNLPVIITSMGSILNNLLDFIMKNLPLILQSGVKLAAELSHGIVNNIPAVISSGTRVLNDLLSTIAKRFPDILRSGVKLIAELSNGIINNISALIESGTRALDSLLDTIVRYLPEILQSGVKLLSELARGIINNIPALAASGTSAVTGLLSTIAKHLPDLLESGIKLIAELAAGVIKAIPDAVAAVPKVISGIVGEFKKHDWKSIGLDIISGIAKGILSGVGTIAEAAKEAAKSALDAAKKKLKINSPSKAMRDEVGKPIPEGIAVGILNNTKSVTNAMRELSMETSGTLQADLAVGIKQAQLSLRNFEIPKRREPNTGGFTQINKIYSPTSLSPYEIARQTRNATRNMALALQKG